jgi:hypothetical protein
MMWKCHICKKEYPDDFPIIKKGKMCCAVLYYMEWEAHNYDKLEEKLASH